MSNSILLSELKAAESSLHLAAEAAQTNDFAKIERSLLDAQSRAARLLQEITLMARAQAAGFALAPEEPAEVN